VYSFESRARHMLAAKSNYDQWRANWALGHPSSAWPDNVMFVEACVSTVAEHLPCSVDAVSGWGRSE